MSKQAFDEFAEKYDSWFLQNEAVLDSEVALLAHFLKNAGKTLSVGCGSGLFEVLLKKDHNVHIEYGLEPAEHMAQIAVERGMQVKCATAEEMPYADEEFDTIYFNGSPSYITDLEKAFREGYRILKTGGKILVLDVPKESSYAMLYNLGMVLKDWDHKLFEGIKPPAVYPLEFVLSANWRTTPQKVDLLRNAGFKNFDFAQTLTRHPAYSNNQVETPVPGYDRGDYVAILAVK
jgi:ubiquinone/menaquinone biosynthesis C-methylase UbiE